MLQRRHCNRLILFLIRNVPDILDRVDEKGYTALTHAAKHGKTDIVESLLQHGASPDIRETLTIFNDTAISWAVYRGHLECVRLLLKYGSDKDQRTLNDGKTLLMWAVHRNQSDVFRLLVENGCCLRKRTRNGYSVMYHLRRDFRFITDTYMKSIRNAVHTTFTQIPTDLVNYIMLFY